MATSRQPHGRNIRGHQRQYSGRSGQDPSTSKSPWDMSDIPAYGRPVGYMAVAAGRAAEIGAGAVARTARAVRSNVGAGRGGVGARKRKK